MRRTWLLTWCFAAVAACSGGRTQIDLGSVAATTAAVGNGSIELAITAADTSTSTRTIVASTTTSVVSTTDTVAPTTTVAVREWSLMAGGDVLMDRSEAAGVDPFAAMVPALATADVAFVNVEMAITARGTPVTKTFVFRAPATAAETIAAAGVDIVSLANNHARDYGAIGLTDTLEALASAGVVGVGAGLNDGEAFAHRVVQVDDGPRVAFVASTQIVPSGFGASANVAGVANASAQRERVLANIRVAAEDADVVIASVHWGIERDTCPSDVQRSFARDLLAAGATVVLGHHPHVLQPVETTDTQLVAYSLGNFVWHPRFGITGDTGILQLDFEDTRLVGWKFHPHLLDAAGAPVPVSEGSRHQRIVDIISGDCARHDPPPITTGPLNPTSTSSPTTSSPSSTPPSATSSPPATTSPATSGAPPPATTAGAPPSTAGD